MGMFDRYLAFGGNEIANVDRLIGYTQTADCPTFMVKVEKCDSLRVALGDNTYDHATISDAPWYDSSRPESERFYGVAILSLSGLINSSRTTGLVEGITDGGVLGLTRRAAKRVRARVLLIADGNDALEYGIAWLNASLSEGACGQHGTMCGAADAEFLVDCPPEVERDQNDNPTDDWWEQVELNKRFLHDCKVTSGPLLLEEYSKNNFRAAEMEFTITSERGYLYTPIRDIDLPTISVSATQDVRFNLVEYPSAEIADSGLVTIATNYVENPSLETNDTDWSVSDGTGQRVSGEVAASGSWSYKVAHPGDFSSFPLMKVTTTIPSGTNFITAGIWAAGTGGSTSLLAKAIVGGTSYDIGGASNIPAGQTFSRSNIPTNGGTTVEITVEVQNWSGSGFFYGDAAFVTVP